jgi:hypothetical protein
VYPLSLALSLFSASDSDKRASSYNCKRAESDKILFYTKADEWSYESELRLTYQADHSESVRFEKDSLVSIIVGPRMADEDQEKLINLVANSPYKGVPIRQARLSRSTFSVEVD